MAAVSRSNSPTPPCSLAMMTLHENNFEIRVTDSFDWKGLSEGLKNYSSTVSDQWEDKKDVPKIVSTLLNELAEWLGDPESQKINTMKAIQFWNVKVEAINDDGHDLPEIIIVNSFSALL